LYGKDVDDDQEKNPTRRRRRPRQQWGEGINTVIAGIPKAGWKITKGLETLAKKKAKKAHLKRMEDIIKGNENAMPENPSLATSCEYKKRRVM